jgi:hypothetical protein
MTFFISVIPATQEVEIGGFKFEAQTPKLTVFNTDYGVHSHSLHFNFGICTETFGIKSMWNLFR